MDKVGIFYGSSTGNTRDAATQLRGAFGERNADLYDVSEVTAERVLQYRNLVFAASTWGTGEMQDDWERFLPALRRLDLAEKRIALLALGDQQNYPETFAGWMGALADELVAAGGVVVGSTEVRKYAFSASNSVRDGRFLGLVLDEDNQAGLSAERIARWVRQLRREFA